MSGRKWAVAYLAVLIAVAVFADFIANDRPIVASVGGKVFWPIGGQDEGQKWDRVVTDWAVWPPIPYAAGSTDLSYANYRSPFGEKHGLGTDRLGRDTAAGLVAGARVAVVVGGLTTLIALLIGLLLGGVAGFFGRGGWRVRRASLLGGGVGFVLSVLYVGGSGWYGLSNISPGIRLAVCVAFVALVSWGLANLVSRSTRRQAGMQKKVDVPVDRVVMQIVELFMSIPFVVLVIALLSLVARPSTLGVAVILGVLGWTSIARFFRAELLRVRELPYLEAPLLAGVPAWRRLVVHALPNAIGPALVAAGFVAGLAVLSESMLSFLGIGIPTDQVSWGTLLRQSRDRPDAWWLAVFPGVLLSLTVLACNALLPTLRAEK